MPRSKLSKEKLETRKDKIFSSEDALEFISKVRTKLNLPPNPKSIPPYIWICILYVSNERGFFMYYALENIFLLEKYGKLNRRKLTRLCGGKFGKIRQTQKEMSMMGILSFQKTKTTNVVSVTQKMKEASQELFPKNKNKEKHKSHNSKPHYLNFPKVIKSTI